MTSSNHPSAETIHVRSAPGIGSKFAANFVLFVVFLLVGIILGAVALNKPNSQTLLPAGLFVVGAFLWLLPVFAGLGKGMRRVTTSSHGITWQRDKREKRVSWEEIKEVYREETIVNNQYRIRTPRIVLQDDRNVVFDQQLSEYDSLAGIVQGETGKRLMPIKRQELAQGSAEFGPVVLHNDGLSIQSQRYNWNEIDQYVITNGTLFVFLDRPKKARTVDLSLALIPNYQVLFDLMIEQGHSPVPVEESRFNDSNK